MGTLRTWAVWSLGRAAEVAEDVGEALHFLADFVDGDVSGIEALRDSFLFDAVTKGWWTGGDVIDYDADTMHAVLVSNEEPSLADQSRYAQDVPWTPSLGPGSYLCIGWPESYEPGNGRWYDIDGEIGEEDAAGQS